MIVSNFELLIKRIAPVSDNQSPVSTAFRRVVQGYFLVVTNLETDRSIDLIMEITIPNATGNRVINTMNTICVFDIGSIDSSSVPINFPPSNLGTTALRFSTERFILKPLQTGLIGLLPNVRTFINEGNPDLEFRGFIELRQLRSPFRNIAEAKVLVSPETRGTFLDDDYPDESLIEELDFDQLAYSMPIASGKAMNVLEVAEQLELLPIDGDDLTQAELREIIVEKNPGVTESEVDNTVRLIEEVMENENMADIIEAMRG